MAFEICKVIEKSAFIHAKRHKEVMKKHLEGKKIVILVDSATNTGKSIRDFVEHIRKPSNPSVQIIVVTDVVQEGTVKEVEGLHKYLVGGEKLHFAALRLSENRYTGKRATDTGHRFFNTTNLD
ncbi:hypothetical protein BS50DRAFT_658134 [Corynespora cassiicola Philippines]|uniref:Phosphoribosyltransferase domain-containing protein n=1 Tax=Corynespora cassiicola Philippines TaxID=1448308 RepID=A0A2T2P3J7_CORCC|nr:hypothetical protein BS50DRAFT_658134 [Corynespora cassiicola Philippines]